MAFCLPSDSITPILLIFVFTSCSHSAPHISKFNSHVSFNTPARSFYHGVGDLHPIQPLRSQSLHGKFRQSLPRIRSNSFRSPHENSILPLGESYFEGYPRQRPLIPFNHLSFSYSNSHQTHVSFGDNSIDYLEPYTIPVLPASPYKVDSPDPESLWPEGLFIPPSIPVKYRTHSKKDFPAIIHELEDNSSNHIVDPYFLDGENALRAITRANIHGELFHHDIPHTHALLANQELRISNGLRPNRLGSIRISSPWFRT